MSIPATLPPSSLTAATLLRPRNEVIAFISSREQLYKVFTTATDAINFVSQEEIANRILYLDFSRMTVNSDQFNLLASRCKSVYEIVMPNSDLSTADFSQLNDMGNLRVINFENCLLPPTGLTSINTRIEELNVALCTPVLQALPPFPNIRRLVLGGFSQMTQTFLRTVQCSQVTFKGLNYLDLSTYIGPPLDPMLSTFIAMVMVNEEYQQAFAAPSVPLTLDPQVRVVVAEKEI